MTLEFWLRGRLSWLLGPGIVSNLFIMALAIPWAAASAHLSGPPLQSFLLLSVTLATLFQGSLSAYSFTRLPTFRDLTSARVSPLPWARLAAVSELARFPRFMASLAFAGWVAGALSLGLLTRFVGGAPWAAVPQVVLVGVLFGALSTLFLTVRLSARVHEAADRLSAGLPIDDVLRAMGTQPSSLRGHAVLFTVTVTLVPLIIGADLARASFHDAVTRLQAAAPGTQAVVAHAFFREVALQLSGLALFSIALAVVIGAAAGKAVALPMQRLADEAQRIARGTLGVPTVIAGDGEVGRVTAVFAQLQQRLVALVGTVLEVGRQLAQATQSLQRTSERAEEGVARQASALNETSATTEELARSARQIAQSAASVQGLAHRTLAAAEGGKRDATAFQAAVERMRQDNQSIAAAVDRLQRRAQQIGRIVELINTVADRSDLLALSAELEGTRAGDVGRGFSLVGAEMRGLAENVLESTAEVEELIAEIRDATLKTAEATERGKTLMAHGTSLADAVTASLVEVARLALQTSNEVRTITLGTQQQQSSTDQLAEVMSEVLAGSRTGVDTSRRLAEVNARLLTLSSSLLALVRRFEASP